MEQKQLTRKEAIELNRYLFEIAEVVPNGLSKLTDTLTFAGIDLIAFGKHGMRGRSLDRAVTFARSIPKFDDFKSDEFFRWMQDSLEHWKYWEK